MKLDNLSLSDYMKIKNLEIHEVNYCKEKSLIELFKATLMVLAKA
ncbi:hypothetical protein [Tenacibaculum maritimum]